MKIVHICVQTYYNDYWGFQDNLLPHYHAKLGHSVTVITTNTKREDSKIVEIPEDDYMLNDGVRVIRLSKSKPSISFFEGKIPYYDIRPSLDRLRPDFIMLHGISSLTILDVVRYKRANRDCIMIDDNHLDYFNAGFKSIKGQMVRLFFKTINRMCMPYFSKVYGVTPIRKEYAIKMLGVPRSKCDVLVMGGDSDKIRYGEQHLIRKELRSRYNIDMTDFLVVTGGKIDTDKNIHLLMEAVSRLEDSSVKLVVFGKANAQMHSIIEHFGQNESIRYIGWIESDKVYDWFLASDLAVFPGTHSVLWEQAVACGIPCVFKHWEGMEHIDVGGNCKFLYNDTEEEIRVLIDQIANNYIVYQEMKRCSQQKAINAFSYLEIAKKALEI